MSTARLRILFVNHTGSFSGAENAMLRLLEALPDDCERAVACPASGDLKRELEERGIRQWDLRGMEASLGKNPVNTARGIADLVRSGLALRRVARRFGASVIHAN